MLGGGGADVRYLAEMFGHAKLEATQIYTCVSIAKLRAVHAATHPADDRCLVHRQQLFGGGLSAPAATLEP